MSDAADKIAKILEDPESIKMISEIAESFMTQGTAENSSSVESSKDKHTDKDIIGSEKEEAVSTLEKSVSSISVPSEISSSMKLLYDIIGKGDVENSIRLISALKPYMSKHRRENADSVLKWLGALKFISKYNISEISKLFGLM